MKRIIAAIFLLSPLLLQSKVNNFYRPQDNQPQIYSDGKTLTTAGIQRLIDSCAQNGGGTVSLSAGTYLTGTLTLRSNVTLNLQKGAKILGSPNIANYPASGRRKALIFAENSKNICITGDGEIDGNGQYFDNGNNAPNRPTLVLFFDCRNVNVNTVRLKNSGFWTFRMVRCDTVNIHNVHVEGHAAWNNDGFDIESKNVVISDCVLDNDDDAICLKSEDPGFVIENVTVSNCDLASNCNFIKFGTASAGGFKNVRIHDCTLHKCTQSNFRYWDKMNLPGVDDPITGISGIALEVVDGGFMEDVEIYRIDMVDVQTPIFIRLGTRKVSNDTYLKNIRIHDIEATSASYIASSITGVPGIKPSNIEISNVIFKLKGGGKKSDTLVDVPEKETSYPENRMFGVMLPAYGFYIRHADNISLKNMSLSYYGGQEERYAIFADDVNSLTIDGSAIEAPSGSLPILNTVNCSNIKYE